jgi:hypothetical protein
MTGADIALALFALCNSLRVFAYVPQIVAIARDQGGANAISYTTWTLFALSNLSTAAYALLVVDDWRMTAVFLANGFCCIVILGMTAWKRALFRAARRLIASPDGAALHLSAAALPPAHEPVPEAPGRRAASVYRVVTGGKAGSV